MNERHGMNERHEEIDLVTEERLRRAVRFRDAEVTPSPDALSRVRQRALEQPSGPGWQRPGLLLGAAAAILLVVGGLVIALRGDGNEPDVATDTTAADPADAEPTDDGGDAVTPSLLPSTTSTAPPITTLAPLPALSPTERADLGLIVWPLDSRSFEDATAVAYSYATGALGIDDPVLETDCCDEGLAVVTIAQRGEDGAPFGEATRLDVVALDPFNWVVVRATSDEVTIASVQLIDEGLATVTGAGRSFEGAARIVARSICDPEGVISPVMVGGGPESGKFVQSVAFVPCDAPLVVELATESIAEDEVPFVTTVAYSGPVTEIAWSVMRVEPDDVLNVRSGPGVSNEIVATLARDATGIEVTNTPRESVNGQPWREIITPDGASGWVNSSYLTAQAELSDTAAETLALDALAFLSGRSEDGYTIHARGLYVGGIGVFADAFTPFVPVTSDEVFSDALIDWNPFPEDASACGTDCVLTVEDFLDVAAVIDRVQLPVATGAVANVSFENQFNYGPIDQLQMFDSLQSVTVEIPATNAGDLDWRRYHVWFDWADGSPKVIAIWRWGWTP